MRKKFPVIDAAKKMCIRFSPDDPELEDIVVKYLKPGDMVEVDISDYVRDWVGNRIYYRTFKPNGYILSNIIDIDRGNKYGR